MKIKKEEVQDVYALSSLQEGMLFYYLKDTFSEYNEQLIIKISGNVAEQFMLEACQLLVDHQSMLRTVFNWNIPGKHVQIVLKKQKAESCYLDVSGPNARDRYDAYCEEDAKKPFDLTQNAIRFSLIKQGEGNYALIITNHHIIYDGWSNAILIRELFEIYEKLSKKQEIVLKEQEPYKNYITWLMKRDKSKELKFWQEYLKDFQPYLKSSGDESSLSQEYIVTYNKDEMQSFAREQGITIAALVYTAWGVLEQKIKRRKDIVFGTTVSGRTIGQRNDTNTVGLFINTIPFRFQEKDCTIADALQNVQNNMNTRNEYEHTAITEIKEVADIGGYDDLFHTIVVVENYPIERMTLEDIKITDIQSKESNNYELTIGVEVGDEVNISFSYKQNVYSKQEISYLAESFLHIIHTMITSKHIMLSEIELVDAKRKEEIYHKLSQTDQVTFQYQTVLERFTNVVKRYPNRTALRFQKQSITYKELDEKAQSLAYKLHDTYEMQLAVIPIVMEHSIEMVIAMFAVMKLGATFVMIDTSMPENRIKQILLDCGATICLSDRNHTEYQIPCFIYNETIRKEMPFMPFSIWIDQKQVAYIIYTSGTTGNPQGVLIEHHSLAAYIEALTELLVVTEDDASVQLSAVTFDTFLEELFLPLWNGGSFTIVPRDEMKDMFAMHELIAQNQITIVSSVPMLLNELNHRKIVSSVRVIISGGDVLHYENISNYMNTAKVYNSYGPSEATIAPMYYRVTTNDQARTIPIGGMLKGSVSYVLDQDQKLCNYGMVGELYIGGSGVSRGYLNNPELTKERFVHRNINGKMEYLYKTNDLAYVLDDGLVRFIGREDGQVKVNGVRIELSEVEARIREYKGISNVVVVLKQKKLNRNQLIAYYVATEEMDDKKLRTYVADYLPQTMIPTMWIQLKKIPLSRHGKVDYKELDIYYQAELDRRNAERVGPENEQEKKILEFWKQILEEDELGVMDDFFEVGGNSIKLVSLYTLIKRDVYECVTVQDLFDYRTIRDLVTYFKKREQADDREVNILEF